MEIVLVLVFICLFLTQSIEAVGIEPSVPVCTFRTDLSLIVGQSAVFRCHSTHGDPVPTYTWYKDGTVLPFNSSFSTLYRNSSFSVNTITGDLTFVTARLEDSGSYHCRATNTQGYQECPAKTITAKQQDSMQIATIVIVALFAVVLVVIIGVIIQKKRKHDAYEPYDTYGTH